jgi:hypothetical protein
MTASAPVWSPGERRGLMLFAAFGMVAVNGAFVWSVLAEGDLLGEAMRNPVAMAFIIEAFALVFLAGWLLRRQGMTRVTIPQFFLLSMVGSLAFSLPVALLLPPRD